MGSTHLVQALHGARMAEVHGLGRASLANASRSPPFAAQIVELRPAHPSLPDHVDLVDHRRVQGEDALHPRPIGDLADGEGFPVRTAFTGDHHPFEHLNAFLLPLDDADMDAYRISSPENRDVRLTAFLL